MLTAAQLRDFLVEVLERRGDIPVYGGKAGKPITLATVLPNANGDLCVELTTDPPRRVVPISLGDRQVGTAIYEGERLIQTTIDDPHVRGLLAPDYSQFSASNKDRPA